MNGKVPHSESANDQSPPIRKSPRLRYNIFYENSTAPSITLNDDILRHIFTLIAHDLARNWEDWNWFAIAHVCRQWRAVALDSGAFWSNIIWDSTSPNMIKAQLLYSKRSNLSLTFIQRKHSVKRSTCKAILNAILAHRQRVTYVYMKVYSPLWDLFEVFLRELSLRSKLKTLRICVLTTGPGSSASDEESMSVRDILSFKELRELRVFGFRSLSTPVDGLIPLQYLTDLDMSYNVLDLTQLRDVLQLCPSLETLSIQYYIMAQVSTNPSTSSSTVQLPFLRYLNISGPDPFDVYTLFEGLDGSRSINLDINYACSPPATYPFNSGSPDSRAVTVYTLFCRHLHYESVYISLSDNAIMIQAEEELKDAQENITVVNTKFILSYKWARWTYTKKDYCSSLIHLIRRTHLRNAENFHFLFDSAKSVIAKETWVEMINAFDNIFALEIALLRNTRTSQMEVAKALKLITEQKKDHSTLDSLSFLLSQYEIDFLKELKRTLCYMKNNSAEIYRLRLRYRREVTCTLVKEIAEFVREIEVESGDVHPSYSFKYVE